MMAYRDSNEPAPDYGNDPEFQKLRASFKAAKAAHDGKEPPYYPGSDGETELEEFANTSYITPDHTPEPPSQSHTSHLNQHAPEPPLQSNPSHSDQHTPEPHLQSLPPLPNQHALVPPPPSNPTRPNQHSHLKAILPSLGKTNIRSTAPSSKQTQWPHLRPTTRSRRTSDLFALSYSSNRILKQSGAGKVQLSRAKFMRGLVCFAMRTKDKSRLLLTFHLVSIYRSSEPLDTILSLCKRRGISRHTTERGSLDLPLIRISRHGSLVIQSMWNKPKTRQNEAVSIIIKIHGRRFAIRKDKARQKADQGVGRGCSKWSDKGSSDKDVIIAGSDDEGSKRQEAGQEKT